MWLAIKPARAGRLCVRATHLRASMSFRMQKCCPGEKILYQVDADSDSDLFLLTVGQEKMTSRQICKKILQNSYRTQAVSHL
jgi:hypothetical protein